MARQNVGNPKFYIDLPSYWMAKGSAVSFGNSGGYSDTSKVFGLNPTDYYLHTHNLQKYTYAAWDIEVDAQYRVPSSLNYPDAKYFFGIFGHNFTNCKGYKATIGLLNNGDYVDSEDLGLFPEWDEICNFPIFANDTQYSGWSLGQRDDFHTYDFDTLRFQIYGNWDATTNVNVAIGSFAFGYAFQMPHSPDLKLTMTREYDGIQQQSTRGGSTLTQINYSRPPHWVGLPAWEFGDSVTSILNQHRQWFGNYPSRGRRVWDLKFSYVSGDDLFSVNEMYGHRNPTDSSTNSEAGYDSTDFDGNGDFHYGGRDEWSFMNIVMNHTIAGSLRFIFQPDGNNNSPDQFAICQLDQDSIKFKQVAHNVYDVSLKIREVW